MGAASSVALPEEDAAAPAAAAGLAAPEAAAAPSPCGEEEDWSWQRVELGRYSVKGEDELGLRFLAAHGPAHQLPPLPDS